MVALIRFTQSWQHLFIYSESSSLLYSSTSFSHSYKKIILVSRVVYGKISFLIDINVFVVTKFKIALRVN